MKLVIVESPSKAKTIQKYLGKEFKVLASGGHIRDLPEKSLGIDIKNNFKPDYVIYPKKKDTVKALKDAVKSSEITYLATDPDREGEAISWHLAQSLQVPMEKNRIEFHEISQKAVNKAINEPREINMRLVDAQQARRVLDRLVGYKVSPILNKKIKSGLSGGRVQSAALKMIVDREREVKAFVPEEYWNVFANLLKKKTKAPIIRATLVEHNSNKLKITNKDQVDTILKELINATYIVDSIKKGTSKSKPSAPFTTSTLQQDGSYKLGLTAPQVMQVAQQLYEGIEIGDKGQTALVTYIRTDSVRISPDMQDLTLTYIKENYGEEFAPKTANFYKSKGNNVQDAHEAIRPIALEVTPDSIKDKVQRNQYKLYKLIYDRYLASQMNEALFDTMNIKINGNTINNEKYGFKVSGKTIKFKGYTIIYDNAIIDEDDDSNQSLLPQLEEKEILEFKDLKTDQKFTKAPPRYTDATLVKAMEENGIGRPSTYASVISVLSKREYTEKQLKNIAPTMLGEKVTEFMEKHFANIVDINFTASMENKLDEVENGVEWQKIIEKFYPPFEKELKNAYFEGEKVELPVEVSDVICDKCGANMIVKDGKFGKFLACPNYPECKNIKSLQEPVGVCPKCSGNIMKRKSKKGAIFYGCSNYPKCTFMSWDLIAPELCSHCNGTMKVSIIKKQKKYICLSCKLEKEVIEEEPKEE